MSLRQENKNGKASTFCGLRIEGIMKEDSIHNIYYFEKVFMRGKKKIYFCICLTNLSDVTIVGPSGNKANVYSNGNLYVV
ncbi:MAG: hypothetical protein HGA87_03575 [Desulfobulbaceae bacterium]|nr:hypothetical protein [Desulfobulbaceae bacterium]